MNILTKCARNGHTLECWATGGAYRELEAPTPPHFWSTYERQEPLSLRQMVRLMSSLKRQTPLYRVDCENVYQVRDLSTDEDYEATKSGTTYLQMLTLLHGFTQKNTDLSLAAFDIEAAAKTGQFPVAGRDPITAISYAEPGGKEEVFTGDELAILDGFCSVLDERNVDCVVTYNGARFDWKYMVDRGHEKGVWLPLGRKDDAPYIRETESFYGRMRGRDYQVYLEGRVIFDVYKEVRMDTAIQGRVANKQLKTVAEYFQSPDRGVIPEDYPIIRLSYAEQRAASKKDLAEYCLSDSRLTACLAEYYMRTLKDLAVYLQAPLNLMVDRTPSHVGNYIYGRAFKRMGVVSDASNYDRFRGVLWE